MKNEYWNKLSCDICDSIIDVSFVGAQTLCRECTRDKRTLDASVPTPTDHSEEAVMPRRTSMNTAAKVREAKEKNPENFCPLSSCLWRIYTRDGFKPCPKHMGPEKQPAEKLTEAIRHLRRTHMNCYSWSMTVSDEEAIDILSRKIVELA